jgi:DNA-binding transcriptional MerR regulator
VKDFTLAPPNRGALWSSLALTKTQLADLCGLTTRQVSHWTSQGYINASGRNPERYNGDAVDFCVLIKQGLQHGLPLRRAVALARAYASDELARQPGMAAIGSSSAYRGTSGSMASRTATIDASAPRSFSRMSSSDGGTIAAMPGCRASSSLA